MVPTVSGHTKSEDYDEQIDQAIVKEVDSAVERLNPRLKLAVRIHYLGEVGNLGQHPRNLLPEAHRLITEHLSEHGFNLT